VNRNTAEILFTSFLLVVVGVAVWEARGWETRARLFPWAIGFPLMGLLISLLIVQISRQLRGGRKAAPQATDEAEASDEGARGRALAITGWLLGFLAAIWILGFPIGGPLATFAYLKLGAREKWPISLAISAGTALFFVIMINGLHTPFPPGTLFAILSPS
jgi:hypothetical protein